MHKHKLDIIPYDCELCSLHKHRRNIVWGNNNMYAPIVFIGEGPGKDEDEQGLAFVGRSGKLLVKVLNAYKIPRNYALFLNLVKCRPPKNINPTLNQILACRPYLTRQIQMCPYIKVIVTLGRVPWFGLTGKEEPVSLNRGRPKRVGKYIYMKTFHPSYILRNHNIDNKKNFMKDIKRSLILSGLIKSKNDQ